MHTTFSRTFSSSKQGNKLTLSKSNAQAWDAGSSNTWGPLRCGIIEHLGPSAEHSNSPWLVPYSFVSVVLQLNFLSSPTFA